MVENSTEELSTHIHETAIVSPEAKIGAGTKVGPYSVVGSEVELGENNTIGPHVVLEGRTHIGAGNHIFQFASIGAAPQDLKYRGEPSRLIIGEGNTIREYVTLQPGTEHGKMESVIGSRNLFMACSHVGHDAVIGDDNVFANSASLAGHLEVGNRVILGGMVGVHQFVRLGDFSFLAAGSMVSQDVPPFCLAQGDRARLHGLNVLGLQRNGFSREEIKTLKSVYRTLFWGEGSFAERLAALLAEHSESRRVMQFLQFVDASERGVAHPARRHAKDD